MKVCDIIGVLSSAFDVAVRYGDKAIIASMLHLSALVIRCGKKTSGLGAKVENILTYATNATFHKIGTTPSSITKAGHEVMQAAASNVSMTGIGSLSRLSTKGASSVNKGAPDMVLSSMIEAIGVAQSEKEGQGATKGRMPAPPKKAAPQAPVRPRPPPPPASEKKVKPPPPPRRRASLVNVTR